jgi:DNA-binding response OmpR family regulator
MAVLSSRAGSGLSAVVTDEPGDRGVRNGAPVRILVVEDDEDVSAFMAIALEGQGYHVDEAATAEEGLRRLQHTGYDLVLSDYALPGKDGVWMLEQAKAAGLLRGTEVVLLTAHPSPSGAEGLRVMAKPIDLDRLLEDVERLVRPHATAKSARMESRAPRSSARSRAKQKRM